MDMPSLAVHNLTKYYGNIRGIDRVDLEIQDGEIFGFIGPNGAGKSTTIRILLNLIFPDSGSARIMGMDVIRDTKHIKQQVGYVPSDANAYPTMRVREFLKYCLRFYAGKHDPGRIDKLAAWFDLDTSRKIADLSMGNRKKVSIVQSLLHKPKLLILDEPTTGLDPLMQAQFFDLLRQENRQGMTIFFSSHILNEVQSLCKRVAIIREGRVIKVEEIEAMRKKQLKKVTLEFSEPVNAGELFLDGIVQVFQPDPSRLTFLFSGDIRTFVQRLAQMPLNNMTLEEPSLEEIFMHYYHDINDSDELQSIRKRS